MNSISSADMLQMVFQYWAVLLTPKNAYFLGQKGHIWNQYSVLGLSFSLMPLADTIVSQMKNNYTYIKKAKKCYFIWKYFTHRIPKRSSCNQTFSSHLLESRKSCWSCKSIHLKPVKHQRRRLVPISFFVVLETEPNWISLVFYDTFIHQTFQPRYLQQIFALIFNFRFIPRGGRL